MSADAAIEATQAGRTQAESLMIDTCTIRRPGEPTTDPDTGVVSPSSMVIYTGKCKVQSSIPQALNPVAGEHKFTVQRSQLHVPVVGSPVAVGDVATIDTCVLDPLLVGREFRVTELLHKTMATAQRTNVEEVVA